MIVVNPVSVVIVAVVDVKVATVPVVDVKVAIVPVVDVKPVIVAVVDVKAENAPDAAVIVPKVTGVGALNAKTVGLTVKVIVVPIANAIDEAAVADIAPVDVNPIPADEIPTDAGAKATVDVPDISPALVEPVSVNTALVIDTVDGPEIVIAGAVFVIDVAPVIAIAAPETVTPVLARDIVAGATDRVTVVGAVIVKVVVLTDTIGTASGLPGIETINEGLREVIDVVVSPKVVDPTFIDIVEGAVNIIVGL